MVSGALGAVAPSEAALQELERVIESEAFAKSPRLSSLLKYICERSWDGRINDLSEQQIGIYFFQRAPGFNASEDAIVRGTARHLRKRLDLYYDREGRGASHRIVIPKGGYVAHLEEASLVPAILERAPDVPLDPPAKPTPRIWKTIAAIALCGIAIGAYFGLRPKFHGAVSTSNGPLILWQALFSPTRRTLIVPGDPALNLYTAYKHRAVPLIQYTEQSYQQDKDILEISPEGPGQLSRVNMASMADLQLVSELVRIPYRIGLQIPEKNVEVRYARDLSEVDLRDANLILLGAASFDPWVSIYDRKLDFQLERGYEHYTFQVSNHAPIAGEPTLFTKRDDQALTIVALTDSPNGNGRVLLIEGSTMGSIYAALHFLFTQSMWQPVMQKATVNGQLQNFEVLLESDFVKDEVSNMRILSAHIH